jgi:hypothetical protein
MKTHNQAIPLTPATSDGESRIIKTAALFTFRGLRAVIDAAKTVPGLVAEAASDVRDAWEESNNSPKP